MNSNFIIEKTKNSPTVVFNQNGNFFMEGRVIAENTAELFDPIIQWMDQSACTNIEFTIKLEYINTSASKRLYDLLNLLDKDKKYETVVINWYYEEGDEDHLYLGHDYESELPRCQFNFHCVSEGSMAA